MEHKIYFLRTLNDAKGTKKEHKHTHVILTQLRKTLLLGTELIFRA